MCVRCCYVVVFCVCVVLFELLSVCIVCGGLLYSGLFWCVASCLLRCVSVVMCVYLVCGDCAWFGVLCGVVLSSGVMCCVLFV